MPGTACLSRLASGDWLGHRFRPAVERVRRTVEKRRECSPHRRTPIADEEHRADAIQCCFPRLGMEPAAEEETVSGQVCSYNGDGPSTPDEGLSNVRV